MSKFNQSIQEIAAKLATDYNARSEMMTYAGVSIKEAIDADILQADVLFAMQHFAFVMGYYIDDLIAIETTLNPKHPRFIIEEAAMCTDRQTQALTEYYDSHHKNKQPCYPAMRTFLQFAAIKSTLFIGKTHIDLKANYDKNLIRLGDDVVVINHLRTSLLTVFKPNKQWHLDINNSPTANHDINSHTPNNEVERNDSIHF
ncbi:hypothetical protein QTV44_002616 [Vibrio vulnificus]|nr:hypothetical protein [Vibrio vulnificus]